MEIAAGFDVADLGDKGLGVDEFFERDVTEVELAADRDHDAVELLFDEGAVGTDTQRRAEDHVEGLGRGAAGFVPHLEAVDFAALAGPLGVAFAEEVGHACGEVDRGDIDVAMVVTIDPFDDLGRHEVGETFGDNDGAVFASFAFAGEHHIDHAIDDAVDRHDLA